MKECECLNWCRIRNHMTNHHGNCEHFNDSLIDVWKIEYDGSWYYEDMEPDMSDFTEGEIVTKEKMHKEIYNNLPEFTGF